MANANFQQNSTQNPESGTTYDDMLKKKEIAPLLNLDPLGPWDIVSESGDLVMVHHKADADMSIYGNLRGVVLDTKVGKIISHSYPHAPKFVSSSLSTSNGKLLLDEKTSCSVESLKMKIGFEGPLIQIFKHGGKVYHSTRKRLESGKSRWGNSKTFDEIWKELNGPEDNVLFAEDKMYSPYCHTFIMNHPDVLVCTKDNVGRGNLIYLGPRQMYSTEESLCPYPIQEVDVNLHVPETVSSYSQEDGSAFSETENDKQTSPRKIYSPESITLEEANKHLLFGFYEALEGYQYLDPRLVAGEFVILEDTETGMMYRVESPAYAWRNSMRNNNPNLLHRLFELMDYAYLKNDEEGDAKYCAMLPLLTFYAEDDLKRLIEKSPIVVWPQMTEISHTVPVKKDDKLYNIWQCFLVSVPLCRQQQVVEYYDYLVRKRTEVVNWLNILSEKMGNLDLSVYSKRVQDILSKTKSFAVDRVRRGQNVDNRTREVKSVEILTRENIRNFISKEIGSSLYRIIREMDRMNEENKVDK